MWSQACAAVERRWCFGVGKFKHRPDATNGTGIGLPRNGQVVVVPGGSIGIARKTNSCDPTRSNDHEPDLGWARALGEKELSAAEVISGMQWVLQISIIS